MAVQITVEGQTPKFLTAPTYTLGRAVECDVRLPENDRMVSRQHARLERDEAGAWWIEDLSTNGTFINGERMSGRRALGEGDQIGIGRTQISFDASAPTSPPLEAGAHNAETFFVNAGELQARVREASSRPSPPPSTSSRPLWNKAAPDGTMVPHKPHKEEPASTSGASAIASVNGTSAASNGAAKPAIVDVDAVHLSEGLEPGADLEPGAERMKQCAQCRRRYALEEDRCPDCASSDFSIKGAAPATVLVTAPDFAPTAVPTAASAPPTSTSTSAPPPATCATPFDRMAEAQAEPRAVPKVASRVAAREKEPASAPRARNGVAAPTPAPFTPRAALESPSVIPAGITFAPPSEVSPKPSLGRAGLACGGAMLLSLFLPWAQVTSSFEPSSLSYLQICRAVLGSASGSAARLGILVPALAAASSLGAALWLLSSRRPPRASSVALALAGALGVLGTGLATGLVRSRIGSVELGAWLFALSSLGALVVGLSQLGASRPGASRSSRGEQGADAGVGSVGETEAKEPGQGT